MGLKKRDFTGRIKASIAASVKANGPLTKREILEELRSERKLRPSVRRVSVALSRLLKSGKIVQVGSRSNARFRDAKP